MRKNIIKLISSEVWGSVVKNKAIVALAFIMVLLFLFATYSGYKNYKQQLDIRSGYQKEVRKKWDDKPDKHPHRMAHYGYLIFRTQFPLSFFDTGLENYMGNSVFLEAHKQNTQNFSEASFSSGLLRFGEISVAMILQILMPLFIFFVGFGCISSERENSTLKIVRSQGVTWKEVIWGKTLGLLKVVNALYLPVLIITILLWLILNDFTISIAHSIRLIGIIISYFIYFLLLCLFTVFISAFSKTSKTALVKLITIWILFIIIMPRAAQAVGNVLYPSPSKVNFDQMVEKELINTGDSHNPDDHHFKAKKDSLLKVYGVNDVKQLPFNYGGFVMSEGEKISSRIYNNQWQKQLLVYEKQNLLNRFLSLGNPFLAIKNLSMALTGTDFNSYINYQRQVERYRYQMAQLMNKLQMENFDNKIPTAFEKAKSISKEHWKELPEFNYQFINEWDVVKNESISILSLILWTISLIALIQPMSKKIKSI